MANDDPRAPYKVYEGDEVKGAYPTPAEARRAQQRLAEAEPQQNFIIRDVLGDRRFMIGLSNARSKSAAVCWLALSAIPFSPRFGGAFCLCADGGGPPIVWRPCNSSDKSADELNKSHS